MMRVSGLLAAIALVAPLPGAADPASTSLIPLGTPLAVACRELPVDDACAVIAEAATMLSPSYAEKKAHDGVAALNARGYEAEYVPAKPGLLGVTTKIFLVSRPLTNRVYVLVTGTESVRDWLENAKVTNYADKPGKARKKAVSYVPPGHGGFRRAVLNTLKLSLIRPAELDNGRFDCGDPPTEHGRLWRYVCSRNVLQGSGPLEVVMVGHSRGVGIAMLLAPALAGWRFPAGTSDATPPTKPSNWPIRIHAFVGFAPPPAIATTISPGFDQRIALADAGLPMRTFLFVNDRDIVPDLLTGGATQAGHRFRIRADRRVMYDGFDWESTSTKLAHSSANYCADVLAAEQPSPSVRPDSPSRTSVDPCQPVADWRAALLAGSPMPDGSSQR